MPSTTTPCDSSKSLGGRLRVAFFFFNDTATTEIYTLSLHDALPISIPITAIPLHSQHRTALRTEAPGNPAPPVHRSEEHTSELQSLAYLACRLLLEDETPALPSLVHNASHHLHPHHRPRTIRRPSSL